MEFILITGLAFFISSLSAILGIGGGIFLVPLLVLFFGYSIHHTIAAVLSAIVPFSLIATYWNMKRSWICYKLAFLLEVPTVAFAVLGALASSHVPRRELRLLFAGLACLTGFWILRPRQKWLKTLGEKLEQYNQRRAWFFISLEDKPVPVNGWIALFLGSLTGFTAGLLGIGGGWLKTPVLLYLFQLSPHRAVGTAIFMILFTSAVASVSHFSLGHLRLSLVLPLILGYSLGALLGSFFLPRVKGERIQKMIGYAMIAAGLSMVVSTVL